MPTTLTPEQQREVVEKVFHEGWTSATSRPPTAI